MKSDAVPNSISRHGLTQIAGHYIKQMRRFFSSFCLLPSAFGTPSAFVLIALVLSNCGFQLRGEQTLPFQTLNVAGNEGYVTVAQLKQAIGKVQGTRIVGNAGQADATLNILGEQRDKVISALSASGRVREYEIRLRVRFQLADKQGNELIPATDIMLFRLLPYDESQVLSKGEEEALLYRDMQSDVLLQIMRRVAAAKPKA